MTVMDEYGRLGELLVYWCEFYTSAANACCLDVPRVWRGDWLPEVLAIIP
jgi:hypothetical protein